jgi:hypothetical protein
LVKGLPRDGEWTVIIMVQQNDLVIIPGIRIFGIETLSQLLALKSH